MLDDVTQEAVGDGIATPPRLVLVVGAARSGTTLTRLLLDAHPEIGCPSEAGLPALMAHMERVWAMVHADEWIGNDRDDPGQHRGDGDPPARWEEAGEARGEDDAQRQSGGAPAPLPDAVRDWIVSTVQRPMLAYCGREGKRLYCDKSLDSVHHLGLVRELFPDVRMVLLFRHVLDTVASGIEASPWGFNAFGYAPYVRAAPENAVAALASYWLDHVSRALAWEKVRPELCHRVCYEDLVLRPEETIIGVQRFLDVAEDVSVLATAFDREPPQGPGDYKVEDTTRVHADSIGHGKRVPVSLLPPALLKAVNEKLEILGYEPLDRGWNAAERRVDGGGRGLWADRLALLMGTVRVSTGDADVGCFAVVAEDHSALRWIIDPSSGTVQHGDGDVDGVLTGTAKDLVLMLTKEENLGVLVRSGRLRHIVADEDEARRCDLTHKLTSLVGLLRRGLDDPDDSGSRALAGHAEAS
ncbi:MAG: sulfotransferase [Steroidobacteraceae bacterium]